MAEMQDKVVTIVDDETEEPGDQLEPYDEDSSNLVEHFEQSREGREELKKLVLEVSDKFDRAWDSTEEFRRNAAKDYKIFLGHLPPKTEPFADCANAHVPISYENITRIMTRMEAEIFANRRDFFTVDPIGPDDEVLSYILSKHGSWQFNEDIPDFFRQQQRGLLAFTFHGDVTCHSFRDAKTQKNCHEILTCDEFVAPYVYTSVKPDYSDMPYYAKVLMWQRHELEMKAGDWAHVGDVVKRSKPSWDDEPDSPFRDAIESVERVRKPDELGSGVYKLVHWEGWLRLPLQTRDRFCQCVYDTYTRHMLLLTIHEAPSWKEKTRYARQLDEKEQYMGSLREYEASEQAIEQAEDAALNDPNVPGAALEMAENARQAMPPPPMPPEWMEAGDTEASPPAMLKEPIYMFSHGVCTQPLAGNLGLGEGRTQADFNRAANVALSQLIDSATLANCQSYLIGNTIRFVENPPRIAPGRFIQVENSGQELKNNFQELRAGPANPQLKDVVDMCYQWGQSSMQAPAVLSGEPGKSGETWRGIATRLEQAMKPLSVRSRNYVDFFLNQILKNNARLNSMYMEDSEPFFIINHKLDPATGQAQMFAEELKAGRRMYERDYRVTFRADLRFSSEAQKIAEADELVQAALQVPQLAMHWPFMYHVIKKSLEARGKDDLVQVLPPPNMPPMPPGQPVEPHGAAGAAPKGPPQQ